MELTRKNIETSEKFILKNNAHKDIFYAGGYEFKLEFCSEFDWPNAHKDIFYGGGYEFKLEWPNAHKDIFYAGGYEFKL